jgi:L-lactate dehydrogenase complex protein LldG
MRNKTEIIQTMKEKAEAVQTVFAVLPGIEAAFAYAIDVTARQGSTTIAAPGLSEGEHSLFAAMCREIGLTLLTENLREHIGSIHTGFTTARWGIAETATVVVESSSEDIRVASMLSETHVAVVPLSRVEGEALSLARDLAHAMKEPGSYLAFISGASRTADIERVLAIGVHGPREFHILLLDDEEA